MLYNTQHVFKNVSRHFRYFKKKYSKTNAISTICGLCSGLGKCGVAVIRISGPESTNVIKQMTNPKHLPKPRMAVYRDIINPVTSEVIDSGLVLWFPFPKSFTGEDICEFQVHGSNAVVSCILKNLTKLENVRLAKPGEFSRRAFFNNKLDLTEIEGLADLLDAETEQQRKQAIRHTKGELGVVFNSWQERLTKCIAKIEANIDFSETDVIEDCNDVFDDSDELMLEMEKYMDEAKQGILIKQGYQVVICGAVNVGKSSFLNNLCKSNRAIVTDIAGTTRDILEVPLSMEGYAVRLIDTAGVRIQTADIIEKEGINRAIEILSSVDTHLHILICSAPDYINNKYTSLVDFIKDYVSSIGLEFLIDRNEKNLETLFVRKTILVINKSDLIAQDKFNEQKIGNLKNVCLLSCQTKDGFDDFFNCFGRNVKEISWNGGDENPRIASLRQRDKLRECLGYMEVFMSAKPKNRNDNIDLVILVESLKQALRCLSQITGRIVSDDILDCIFRNFCIGK